VSTPVVLRDPLWNTIRLSPEAVRIVDAPAFQRLRHIKQLGHAHLVYPGATHTRFDHAIGVYHLAVRALAELGQRGALEAVDPVERACVPIAALLHDIGHYPFSHALEELQAERIPGHHEALVGRFLAEPEVAAALEAVAADAPARVEALIRGRSTSPLQGLVSGSLDLDKIEYLKRDARFCGVPYGEVDVDRLLQALMVLEDPATGAREIGVHEKGVAALESLLFSKYQMFRNVYWHHAVRAATVLYKRLVGDALDAGLIQREELVGATDEALMFLLAERSRAATLADAGDAADAADSADSADSADAGGRAAGVRMATFLDAMRNRRLPKRAAEIAAAHLPGGGPGDWLETDSPFKRAVEDRIAVELGLRAGGAFLDYPAKTAMFGLELLVLRQDGAVVRVGPGGHAGLIGLPRVADELYRTARVLRLFTLDERRVVAPERLAELAVRSEAELTKALEAGGTLLA